jgi:hypothetical protein
VQAFPVVTFLASILITFGCDFLSAAEFSKNVRVIIRKKKVCVLCCLLALVPNICVFNNHLNNHNETSNARSLLNTPSFQVTCLQLHSWKVCINSQSANYICGGVEFNLSTSDVDSYDKKANTPLRKEILRRTYQEASLCHMFRCKQLIDLTNQAKFSTSTTLARGIEIQNTR